VIEIETTDVQDVLKILPRVHSDHRGYFLETHNVREYTKLGLSEVFVQDNLAQSTRGTLRGLHYQIRQPQAKLVCSIVGEIFDVAVDLRKGSPTFSKWIGTHLTADTKEQVWVPAGFAHGYLVLSEMAIVAYKVTSYYAPEWERVLQWNDPLLSIEWPLGKDQVPILSPKDANGMSLQDAETFDYVRQGSAGGTP